MHYMYNVWSGFGTYEARREKSLHDYKAVTEEEKEGEWKDCFPSPNVKTSVQYIIYVHVHCRCTCLYTCIYCTCMNVVITCMIVYLHFTCLFIHDIVINLIGTTTYKTTIYMECDRSITSDDSKPHFQDVRTHYTISCTCTCILFYIHACIYILVHV